MADGTSQQQRSGDLTKLIALEPEDLAVVAAHMQDALTSPPRMLYQPDRKAFLIEANRFVWERAQKRSLLTLRKSTPERRNTVLEIAGVTHVAGQGINQGNDAQVLSLLTLQFEENDAPAGRVTLLFADNKALRLDVECLEVQMTDMGGRWQAKTRPRHGV